ncbi:MAG TPA: tRNA uracil 4-sulfurtransferase ThiI [Candidatus Norongarragalinales archaeon]|jgi:thiamine biosynthesis protein ThiI|nr:tRNA uracil 4-sulfurtransferase ThiI [Candidatus Norongarragalinales archaeon]
MDQVILAHYSAEVGIKGQNRRFFEQMVRNAAAAMITRELGLGAAAVKRLQSRFHILPLNKEATEISEVLPRVFGLSWFAIADVCEAKPEAVEKKCEQLLAKELSQKPAAKSFSIDFNRADKRYPGTSLEARQSMGKKFSQQFAIRYAVKDADIKLFVEVTEQGAFIFGGKTQGAGGLPFGSSGKAVVLLSGGIDSPVASWMLMRRGMIPIFLHLHPFRDDEAEKTLKIQELAAMLSRWSPQPLKLYAAPFTPFLAASLSIPERFSQVAFRRFMFKLACAIGEKENAEAIATGESLGQVASQTIKNMSAIDSASSLLVLRPLVALDKQDIIKLAQGIGTFEKSLEQYNDCCVSLNPKHPSTSAPLRILQDTEEKMGIEKIVAQTLEATKLAKISSSVETVFQAA